MEVSVQSASRTADKYDSVRWPSVKDRRAGWSRTATASGDEGHHMRHETLARRRRVRSVMGVPSNQGHGGQELGGERSMTVSDVSAAQRPIYRASSNAVDQAWAYLELSMSDRHAQNAQAEVSLGTCFDAAGRSALLRVSGRRAPRELCKDVKICNHFTRRHTTLCGWHARHTQGLRTHRE